MILTLHIIVAVLSIIGGIYSLAQASRVALKATYLLGGLTAASGLLLAILHPNQITHVCISGVATLAIIGTLAHLTHRKLSPVTISSRD